MDAYSLLRHKETEELHLFKGTFNTDGSCTAKKLSICEGMDRTDAKLVFKCKDEHEARTLCAIEGRGVCGVCVSHLYTTYED